MLGHLDKLENHPTNYTRSLEEFEIVASKTRDIKDGDIVKGGIYLLKNYKQDLLKLPFSSCYTGEEKTYIKP